MKLLAFYNRFPRGSSAGYARKVLSLGVRSRVSLDVKMGLGDYLKRQAKQTFTSQQSKQHTITPQQSLTSMQPRWETVGTGKNIETGDAEVLLYMARIVREAWDETYEKEGTIREDKQGGIQRDDEENEVESEQQTEVQSLEVIFNEKEKKLNTLREQTSSSDSNSWAASCRATAKRRLFEKLRACKETGVLRKSFLVDFTSGSDFQILEWAGDRHLKSLLADIALQTSQGLLDEGELSKLCEACDENANLIQVFDLAGMAKLVDQLPDVSIRRIGYGQKRKSDVVEAVIGELHQKRATHQIANEALDMLVAFIYDIGLTSGYDAQTKHSVTRLNDWMGTHNKKVDYFQQRLDNEKWLVSASIEGYPSPCGVGEGSDIKTAKEKAAENALKMIDIS